MWLHRCYCCKRPPLLTSFLPKGPVVFGGRPSTGIVVRTVLEPPSLVLWIWSGVPQQCAHPSDWLLRDAVPFQLCCTAPGLTLHNAVRQSACLGV